MTLRQQAGIIALSTIFLPVRSRGQFSGPEDAHVNMYFPQFADGGTQAQQWQTSVIFVNPDLKSIASVQLSLYGDDGAPLSLDFGFGPASHLSFSVPAGGSRIFTSKMTSPSIVTGWALAYSTSPLQATVLFRALRNGIAQQAVSAPATLPSLRYWSPANDRLGIAIANQDTNGSISVQLIAKDSEGRTVGSNSVTLGPNGHASFNAFQIFPNLPVGFYGAVQISGSSPFVAWTLHADSDVFASLPPGRLLWPISHWDRIWLIYSRVFNAARNIESSLISPAVTLDVNSKPTLNAWADRDGIHIYLALSELISDSESELAFVVGHELGHVVQFRTGRLAYSSNPEWDADVYGMLFSLASGFDPYAAAGALAKLAMAGGKAGLLEQNFDHQNLANDPHGSFNTRIDRVFDAITSLCAAPDSVTLCDEYKSTVHPHFPKITPLSINPPAPTR